MATDTELWRITELRNRAVDALSTGYEASENGQVSPVPDARTIRYYNTLGLVDKPAEMRGRTAYYGRRHLLQLVAIKRLQAKGLRLVEVQEKLSGLGDEGLEDLARVPTVSGPAKPGAQPAGPSSRRESFWNAPVQAAEVPVRSPGSQAGASNLPQDPEPAANLISQKALSIGVRSQLNLELAPGVHVIVDTSKTPNQADREILGQAAQGLLDALRACGLYEPQTRRDR